MKSAPANIEYKTLGGLEMKALGAREFEGHGSIFGNEDLGGDVVMPGAFKRTLAEHRTAGALPQMFWAHKSDSVPGMWLDMHEDAEGLAVKGLLAATPLGDEVRTLLQMKAVRGLSIGYVTRSADYKGDTRLLTDVDLWEVSIVSLAMNPLAQVNGAKARLSAVGEWVPSERDLEEQLRGIGYSKAVARTMVSKIFDDAAGGMPGARWDAGAVDDEARTVLESLKRLTNSTAKEAFRR